MGKNKSKASYPDNDADWQAWKKEELDRDAREEERAAVLESSKNNN